MLRREGRTGHPVWKNPHRAGNKRRHMERVRSRSRRCDLGGDEADKVGSGARSWLHLHMLV